LVEINSALRLSIIPTSISSNVIVILCANMMQADSDSGNGAVWMYRGVGGTNLTGASVPAVSSVYTGGGQSAGAYNGTFIWIDAPSTTSAITYTPYWAASFGTYRLNANKGGGTVTNRGLTTITLMEILP
jgi:hypothetical protein